MPRTKHIKKRSVRKKARNVREAFATSPDLSIAYFADAVEPKERSKKILQSSVKPKLKEYESLKSVNEELLWYEKDDWDLESPTDKDCSPDDHHDVSQADKECQYSNGVNVPNTCCQEKNRKMNSDKSTNSFSGDNVYPLDIWYILSQFIRPEGVLQFSLICKGACQAVFSPRFWLQTYRIYVHEADKLSAEELRPDRIDCHPGLRARVVRALFHRYDVLKQRLISPDIGSSSCIDPVRFYTCSSMWFQRMKTKKGTKICMFYFKMCQQLNCHSLKVERFSKKWFDTVNYVRDNPEERYVILAVSCMNFICFQPVLGLVLTEVLVGISQGMKHSRVKLMFHSHRKDKRYRPESGCQVILDPVQDIRILNWWHPLCPHAVT